MKGLVEHSIARINMETEFTSYLQRGKTDNDD